MRCCLWVYQGIPAKPFYPVYPSRVASIICVHCCCGSCCGRRPHPTSTAVESRVGFGVFSRRRILFLFVGITFSLWPKTKELLPLTLNPLPQNYFSRWDGCTIVRVSCTVFFCLLKHVYLFPDIFAIIYIAVGGLPFS